ncbi:uncharacterized protein LOC110098711 isoform X2 [Dendrobium catenatum]|uniref:uncharacterized protein LOC110098711 isoform X2 n=1 Tax=Dendrobium catenatum TaxID=906689 RepID=UPI0009F4A462|nr:uncharacterized protein LOC110098711 isoform X2 [Dendrobium catenatum]
MWKEEGEPMQEDRAEEFTTMDHVDSIEDRVKSLLESSEANFNAWVLLVADVENTSPDDIQKICFVYDSFLSEFPLCYGYWTRYAGHKARICTLNEVDELYERAVKIASYSVHLWLSYCNFAISSFEDPSDVRRLFQRGLSYVDKDYLCHLLWDKYIEFEYCQKQWDRLAHIYINTLRFPTRRLQSYYESFKKLVALLEEQMGSQNAISTPPEAVPDCEMTHVKGCGYSEISDAVDLLSQCLADPEDLKKYLSIGELLHHKSSQLDKSISCFEAHIQRQYFHVKPLDEFQLENWHEYLTFVEEQGNFDWTVKLYERCLIPCANYLEFWIRYVDFVDANGGREIANDALERALKVFLKRIPAFHQYYSMYKEKIGDKVNACAPFLQSSEGCTTVAIEYVSRRANMEKRLGNIEAAQEIYDKAIKMAHEKHNLKILPLLYVNFARFTFVVTHSVEAAKEVFIKGIQQNPCKLIIEAFIDFMTMHGGTSQLDSVDCKMAALLSPDSDVSQALSFQDREEISQLYLKFVDLYGTIDETRLAWERHRKLFPHIMRPSSIFDYSSHGFQIQSKKTEGRKGTQTNSPNHSSENPSKKVLIKHAFENHSPVNMPIILPEETLNCDLKSYGKADNDKESQESIAAEANHIHEPSFPGGSIIDVINEIVQESQNVAQIPDASSEYHETEMPAQSYMQNGNLEPPALDNLSIGSTDYATRQTNTVTSHDNNAPQEETSKEDGNKFEGDGDDGEVSIIHSSGEKILKSDSDGLEKLQEYSSHSHPTNHATRPRIKTEEQLKFEAKIDTIQALPVNAEYPQIASGGGQWAQLCYGVQGVADPNSILCGNIQPSNPQQSQMQNQSGGTNQEVYLTQSHVSLNPSLPNSQDPQANHTQLQYQLAASQAYTNPGLAFFGQHMQQPAVLYAPDQQVQHASSQTQTHAYQNVSQSDERYGYYQSFQGYEPHMWQYYQNLYYLQQQQLQQRQQGQQMNDSHKQQLTDHSKATSSQQESLENLEERVQLQVHTDTQQHNRNLDEKLNASTKQQNQQEKQEESTQPYQQSTLVMNSEQYQLLYLQQQQHFYLQQQQHHQMYMQQQQQQQQQQQLLLFQQQQLLQLQHQPMQLQQQQQSPYPQQDYQLQHQTNAVELKAVESNVYAQGKGDPLQSAAGQSANSHSIKQSVNSPNG